MKDLAVHTRLSPEQRQREIGKLVDCMKKYVTWVPPVLLVIHIFHDKLISCKILVNLTLKKKNKSQQEWTCFNWNAVFEQRWMCSEGTPGLGFKLWF